MRFWSQIIVVYSVLIVVQCIAYILGYIDLLKLCQGVLLVFVVACMHVIYLAYGIRYLHIRYQTSKKMRLIMRIAFPVGFGWIAWWITFFGGAFIIWATGLPPPTDYLGQWPTFILMFIVPWIVGGYIGYRIGKRRNYRPYI